MAQAAQHPRVKRMIQSNETPLDPEKSTLIATVAESNASLANLDRRIALARNTLDLLISHRQETEIRINETRVILILFCARCARAGTGEQVRDILRGVGGP